MDNINVVKRFWDNGNLKKQTPLFMNKKHGTEIYYYINGVVETKIDFEFGVIDGFVKTYFESGVLESKQQYKNGKKIDDLVVYNEDGEITYSSSKNFERDDYKLCKNDTWDELF